MASSGSVFSNTLQSITTTKLTELSKKRKVFEEQKTSLHDATGQEANQKKKLRLLVDGVKGAFSIKTKSSTPTVYAPSTGNQDPRLEIFLRNLERFLAQAQYDPSISPKLLQDWEISLNQELNVQSLKYQYATLYGELVTEWLSSESEQNPKTILSDGDSEMMDDFEHVLRETQAKDEGRAAWEKVVFEAFETDQAAIAKYLHNIFGNNGSNKNAIKAILALRKSVEQFELTLGASNQFNNTVMKWVINGLLSSSLLSAEKSAALRDFLASPVILTEVADVLNMRMASLDTWEWDADGLPVEQRRHVTGKHHIYIEEDLLQAIFLYYIGIKWSVFLKKAFTEFSESEGAWTSLRDIIPKVDKERREYFLGAQMKKPSVQSKRQGLYRSIYFMSQLPDYEQQERGGLPGDEEVDFNSQPPTIDNEHALQDYQMQLMLLEQQNKKRLKMTRRDNAQAPPMPVQMAQQRAHQQATGYQISQGPPMLQGHAKGNEEYDPEDYATKPKSPMETKQVLLHLLSTEILLNTRLHGEFTCVHSEFKSWFGSLPHSTIGSVLKFLGLSPIWLRFFKKFLESPLKFVQHDVPSKPKIRKRGAPGAHALSAVCGEAILFCLDYAINQKTSGAQLYRLHDDFWIWSSNHQTVVSGWAAIKEFNDIMGVSLNMSKTGSVRIVADKGKTATLDPSLPTGDIRWGFLYLDPISGRFNIDQSMIDQHIEELKRQLQDKPAIFSWIQAWNTFAGRFFTSNFGKPANCFGREHVDSMLQSLERIQRTIFSDTSVVEYLKSTIQKRFGIIEIPDGYLYFPASLGGLELHNSFIGLVQLRDSVFEAPERAVDNFLEAELEEYQRAKTAFENGEIYSHFEKPPANCENFFSYEEFTRYREEFATYSQANLYAVFENLLKQPTAETVDINVADNLTLSGYSGLQDGYWKWIAQLYGPDMIERFGGLSIVDPGLLPIGMVNLFREGKVKWQG